MTPVDFLLRFDPPYLEALREEVLIEVSRGRPHSLWACVIFKMLQLLAEGKVGCHFPINKDFKEIIEVSASDRILKTEDDFFSEDVTPREWGEKAEEIKRVKAGSAFARWADANRAYVKDPTPENLIARMKAADETILLYSELR